MKSFEIEFIVTEYRTCFVEAESFEDAKKKFSNEYIKHGVESSLDGDDCVVGSIWDAEEGGFRESMESVYDITRD